MTRKIIEGGEELLGFARKHLRMLANRREALGVFSLKKEYLVGGYTVSLLVTKFRKAIHISGGAGLMLFCRRNGESAEVFAYDYLTRSLQRIGSIPAAEGELELFPFHDQRSHLVSPGASHGYRQTTAIGGDIEFEYEDDPPVLIAFRLDQNRGREYGVAITGGVPVLYARTAGTPFRKAATFPTRSGFKWAIEDGDDPRAFQISGGVVYLGGYWSSNSLWNLFNGYEFFGYNPDEESASIRQWFSEVWFLEPGEWGTSPGIKWADTYGPLDNVETEFGCLLDDRTGSSGPGHCEMYLSGEVIGDAGAASVSPVFTLALRDSINSGSSDSAYFVDMAEYFVADDPLTYHFWSYEGGWAVVVQGDSGAWSISTKYGYLSGGSGYVFHTVSTDGAKVFIALVDRGIMVDLIEQEVTDHPLILGFDSGCYISEKSSVGTEISTHVLVEDQDTVTPDPSMGEVRPGITYGHTMANDHWKVVCEEGFRVKGFLWKDPCWVWEATAVKGFGTVEIDGENYLVADAPYIVGSTYDDEVLFGVWSEDAEAEVTVDPVDIGEVSGIDYIQEYAHPGVFFFPGTPLGYPEGTLHLENGKTPVVWSGANVVDPFDQEIEATGVYGLPISACDEETTITAIDFCGREGTADVTFDLEELTILGTDEPAVDDQYTAGGGSAPYTWAFTGGTIDNEGKITGVTDCGGPDGNGAVASVTVTDDCGSTAYITVRLPGGEWSEISSCWSGTGGVTYCYLISGSTRKKYAQWLHGGSEGIGCPEYIHDSCSNSPCQLTLPALGCFEAYDKYRLAYGVVRRWLAKTEEWICV